MARANAMQSTDQARAVANRPGPAFGNPGPKATTNGFHAGDVGAIRGNLGHYIENTGSGALQAIEVFRASKYQEVSLAEWFGHVPPELLMQHFNLSREDLEKFPKDRRAIVPVR